MFAHRERITKPMASGYYFGIERRAAKHDPSPRVINFVPPQNPKRFVSPFMECANRSYLISTLDHHIVVNRESNFPVAVILVQLLGLDQIHSVCAETAMRAVARIFRSHSRPQDIILRYQFDTLCLVLPQADLQNCEIVKKRLEKAITRRLFFGKYSITVAAAFGIAAQVPEDKPSGYAVLTKADADLQNSCGQIVTLTKVDELSLAEKKQIEPKAKEA
jgi:diguanylate cyclase (GGDEF)-like protein